MPKGRYWTKEEDEYILEKAGKVKPQTIADKLDRSFGAVECRMYKLGVSNAKLASGKITANELAKILGVDPKQIYNWTKKFGLKAEYRIVRKTTKYYLIDSVDFWEWADNNRFRLNISRIEPKVLMPEPDWVEEQRRKDFYEVPKRRHARWTKEEDAKLINLFHLDMSKSDMAKDLKRSESAIERRISTLRTKGILPKKRIIIMWTQEEMNMLLEFEKQGLSDKEIAYELGREKEHITQKRKFMRDNGQYQGFKNR